jgi:hypothetical protein
MTLQSDAQLYVLGVPREIPDAHVVILSKVLGNSNHASLRALGYCAV